MKKALMVSLMMLFIYTLTFDIFMNRFFRIPTPLISCLPLILMFRYKGVKLLYKQEIFVLAIALLLRYFIGNNNLDSFTINAIVLTATALYFNYFVGLSIRRFNYSILLFIAFLLFSTSIMLLNQINGVGINHVRSLLIGAPVRQSPSGISATIFTFGYQLAPIVTFIVIFACTLRQKWIVIIPIALFSILSIYLGLQRSVFVSFLLSILIFSLVYYRFKSVIIIALTSIAGFFLYNYAVTTADIGQDNILAKNDRTEGGGSRAGLVTENLKIITDYPYGLIFYGKNWEDVSKDYSAFKGGLTSHNAYLLFITYLGPFLGIGLLIGMYYRVGRIFKTAIVHCRLKENALLISLCFSFLAVSLNALFHNAWLLTANGPTIFLFFGILHLGNLMPPDQGSKDNP